MAPGEPVEQNAVYITLLRHAPKRALPLKRPRKKTFTQGPPVKGLRQYLDANFASEGNSRPLPDRSWAAARRKGTQLHRQIDSVPTILYDSPYMRTLQTAVAVAETFHPEIKPLTAHNPDNIFDTNLQNALVRADIRPLRKLDLQAHDDTGFGRPPLSLEDLHTLYRQHARSAPKHVILVSHTEIRSPLIRRLAQASPEAFNLDRIEARIRNACRRIEALATEGELGERNRKQQEYMHRIEEAEPEERAAIKDEMYEWQDEYQAAPKTKQEVKIGQLSRRIGKWSEQRDLGINLLEHVTLQCTPDATVIHYRGKQTRLPPLKEILAKTKAA